MASSSNDRGEPPFDRGEPPFGFELDSPDALKKLALSNEKCEGCLQSRSDLDDSRTKRCGGCHSFLYCSAACQLTHWQKEHKQECKKITTDRADVRGAAGSSLVDDLEQWVWSSTSPLACLMGIMLHEAATSVSRPGALVTVEDLGHQNCVVVNADYTPGSRLPFRILDDYRLVSFEELEGSERSNRKYQTVLKEMREAAERDTELSRGLVPLNMLVNVDRPFGPGVTKVFMTKEPKEVFDNIGDIAGPEGMNAAVLVSRTNSGLGGVGTTKSSAASQTTNRN